MKPDYERFGFLGEVTGDGVAKRDFELFD